MTQIEELQVFEVFQILNFLDVVVLESKKLEVNLVI
jgi:hypothetical protein